MYDCSGSYTPQRYSSSYSDHTHSRCNPCRRGYLVSIDLPTHYFSGRVQLLQSIYICLRSANSSDRHLRPGNNCVNGMYAPIYSPHIHIKRAFDGTGERKLPSPVNYRRKPGLPSARNDSNSVPTQRDLGSLALSQESFIQKSAVNRPNSRTPQKSFISSEFERP